MDLDCGRDIGSRSGQGCSFTFICVALLSVRLGLVMGRIPVQEVLKNV